MSLQRNKRRRQNWIRYLVEKGNMANAVFYGFIMNMLPLLLFQLKKGNTIQRRVFWVEHENVTLLPFFNRFTIVEKSFF